MGRAGQSKLVTDSLACAISKIDISDNLVILKTLERRGREKPSFDREFEAIDKHNPLPDGKFFCPWVSGCQGGQFLFLLNELGYNSYM